MLVQCDNIEWSVRPLDVMKTIGEDNIESRSVCKPLHMQPFFAENDYVGGGVSEGLFEKLSACVVIRR